MILSFIFGVLVGIFITFLLFLRRRFKMAKMKYKTLGEKITEKYYTGLYNYPADDYEIIDQLIVEELFSQFK